MDNVIERIRKMIAHERSAREIGSTAEAEAFAEKIQALLVKHRLSMNDLEMETLDEVDPVAHVSAQIKNKHVKPWLTLLAHCIAVNFFCKVLFLDGTDSVGASFIFIGRNADRLTALELFLYFSEKASSLARQYAYGLKPGMLRSIGDLADSVEGKKSRTQSHREIAA
jgi:hypothetical protein